MPALITPFDGGKVDFACIEQLVDWQISAGAGGLVPCGTTGESPTLSHQEHERVIEAVVEAAAGAWTLGLYTTIGPLALLVR